MMFDLQKFLASTPRAKVMGIVNATGDSFSEGLLSSPDSALNRAEQLLQEGADLLDLGGESTRPGAAEVPPAVEIDRVIPVIEVLHRRHPECIISIDTRHKETAQAALEAGAVIINDVSMLRHAPEIAGLAAQSGAALVLCHSRGTPGNMQSNAEYPSGVAAEVAQELQQSRLRAVAAGVAPEQILLDPGIGFAKNAEQSWELLRDLEKVAPWKQLLIGVSRKSFLGPLTGESDPRRRQGATLAVELLTARRGAAVIRTHNVRELHHALLVLEQLEGADVC